MQCSHVAYPCSFWRYQSVSTSGLEVWVWWDNCVPFWKELVIQQSWWFFLKMCTTLSLWHGRCFTFSILFIVWVLGYLGAPVKEEVSTIRKKNTIYYIIVSYSIIYTRSVLFLYHDKYIYLTFAAWCMYFRQQLSPFIYKCAILKLYINLKDTLVDSDPKKTFRI